MAIIEQFDNRDWKQKFRDWRIKTQMKVEDKAKEALEFCKENKELVAGVAVVAIPAVCKTVSSIARASAEKAEDRRRKTDIYDRRTDTHWFAKKPLSTDQQLELERRYAAGESKGQVLKEWHLI